MSRREDEELMAFLDGELPPRDAREVEARIDGSAETRTKVEALGELSTLVRTHYEQATSASEPNMAAAWAKLEAQLGNAPAPAPQGARADSARAGAAVGVAAGALLVATLRPAPPPESARRELPPQVTPPAVVTASAEDTNVDDLEVASGTGMVF